MEKQPKDPSAHELLSDWRAAERSGDAARAAATIAGLAVETADAARDAAAEAETAVTAAAEAVEHAKNASDQAKTAATRASKASRMIYAEAEKDEARTAEVVQTAEAEQERAGDAFREAQARGFTRDPA